MYRFIETIRLENGKFGDLSYHEARMNKAVAEVLRLNRSVNLEEILAMENFPASGLHKVRLVYSTEVHTVEVTPYSPRSVESLKIVHSDTISYSHKFEDRQQLNNLFEQRGTCDDVIIVKDNLITDSSYANLAFKIKDRWVTPRSYLLNGTMRQQLIDKKIITEDHIALRDLERYESVKLINAMLGFDGPEIEVSKIVK
ncbi:MAG: aminotransferase class IV [Bacteroidetes bacterium]|nr:aminotransferase class IV [Bacteroidota bacterium]